MDGTVFVFGTSHAVASIDVRERLRVELDELHDVLVSWLEEDGAFEEALPLATCGRLEIYGVSTRPVDAIRRMARYVRKHAGVLPEDLRRGTFFHRDRDAIRHAFRVAAGLDSVVHGEAQILGQVRDAAHDPRALGKGTVLHRLFDAALTVGKRVRTETGIGRGAASLARAGLDVVRDVSGDLRDRTVLVVGSGKTGTLVGRILTKDGVGRVLVANRTEANGRRLAEELGGEYRPLEELSTALAEADVVVGTAGGPGPLVTADEPALRDRSSDRAPLYMLDLGHPRNFAPAVGELDRVRLYDLGRIAERVEAARETRRAQIPHAEAIVTEHVADFECWMTSRSGIGVLRAVREHVMSIARIEAERLGRGKSAAEQEELTNFARSLARRILHNPTVALRAADPADAAGGRILRTAPELFGLAPETLCEHTAGPRAAAGGDEV